MPTQLRSGIPGVNRTALWTAWKQIRQELRHSRLRDVVDHLEFDLDPEVWIRRLVRQLADGSYEPATPRRFTVAKGNGFSRRMTLPSVPDLVLYRAIAYHCYRRAARREGEHVYFERSKLAHVQTTAVQEAVEAIRSPYTGFRRRRFYAWLKYDQYRKYLIFERVFSFIVVSDVTNFFDSIQYQRVGDALAGVASARMLGLLYFLLERLSLRDAYSGSPSVGLPVDEFDCSRAIAHMVLFPHDERLVQRVGDSAYVRWMDDQNIGVNSRAEARRTLGLVGESLSRLHLTANGGKSKILSLSEARRYFHLDLNGMLDDLEADPSETVAQRRRLRVKLRTFWTRARQFEGIGQWDKVLKRTYRLVGLGGGRWLRLRAARDIQEYPDMVDRIADYIRVTGSPDEYLRFAESVWKNPEQIHSDVNLAVFERVLLLEATGGDAARIRALSVALLRGSIQWPGYEHCASVAPLAILKFGDRRSVPVLKTCIERRIDSLPADVIKACAVVFASYGRNYFAAIRRAAGRMLRGELSETIRMLERIMEYEQVPERFNARVDPIWDAVTRHHYVDIRRVLGARLLLLNDRRAVRSWIAAKASVLSTKQTVTDFDRQLLKRLLAHS